MAPKAEKKPAKKVAKTAKTGGKKKSKAKVESFKIYIYKVLKQVSCTLSCVCAAEAVSSASKLLDGNLFLGAEQENFLRHSLWQSAVMIRFVITFAFWYILDASMQLLNKTSKSAKSSVGCLSGVTQTSCHELTRLIFEGASLKLFSPCAGAPRHRNLLQGYLHPELLHH
jgi:hypothetical protein